MRNLTEPTRVRPLEDDPHFRTEKSRDIESLDCMGRMNGYFHIRTEVDVLRHANPINDSNMLSSCLPERGSLQLKAVPNISPRRPNG